MKCDCINEIERQLADHMKPKAGADAEARAQNMALLITDDMELKSALQIPFRVKGSGKGFASERGKEVPVTASCCPFCGRSTKRYEVGQDEGIASAMRMEAA